jgi:hypothetical protein
MAERDLNKAEPLDPLATELEAAVARFEDIWHRGETPVIDDFLPRVLPATESPGLCRARSWFSCGHPRT